MGTSNSCLENQVHPRNLSQLPNKGNLSEGESLEDDEIKFYEGELNNSGQRHGQGTCYYKNESTYIGSWFQDLPEGQGAKQWDDGRTFEGAWHKGQPHGHGCLTYKTGSQYVGQFVHGLKKGYGEKTWANGTIYKGEWDDDCTGEGEIVWPSNVRYQGKFLLGMCHGKGTKTWTDGRVYTGEWQLNEMHGKGTMTYADKSVYTGDFVANKRHGLGKFENKNGKIYDGGWREDMRHGQATIILISGHKMTTEFVQDKQKKSDDVDEECISQASSSTRSSAYSNTLNLLNAQQSEPTISSSSHKKLSDQCNRNGNKSQVQKLKVMDKSKLRMKVMPKDIAKELSERDNSSQFETESVSFVSCKHSVKTEQSGLSFIDSFQQKSLSSQFYNRSKEDLNNQKHEVEVQELIQTSAQQVDFPEF